MIPILLFGGCELIPADDPSELSDGSVAIGESSSDAVSSVPICSEDAGSDSGADLGLTEYFSIAEHIADFDDAPLVGCSFIDDVAVPLAGDTAVAAAVEAYRSSEFYGEALELAEKMFTLENGKPVVNDSSEQPLWLVYGYYDYLAADMGTVDFRCDVVASAEYALDGENGESIVLLRVPLPYSRMDWSGHTDFHVPVYVNASGAAEILYDACRQDYSEFRLLCYTDGTVHAFFDFGHNESGHSSAIYSFKDGGAELKLSGCPVSVYRNMLLGGFGWDTFEPFLLDAESGEFCALAAVKPDAELAGILCSDKTVLTYVPNARELYENGMLQIIGGRYATFATGSPWSDSTFIFNGENKCFERVRPVVVTGTALPETITRSYNVRIPI